MATDKHETEEQTSIEGVITQQDLEDARRLHGKVDWLVAAAGGVIVGLVLIVMLNSYIVGAVLAIPVIFVLQRWRRWAPYEIAGESIKRTIDGSGLWLATRGGTKLVDWEQLYRSRRSDKLVILFARGSPPSFIFPRRLFAGDDQWRTFRDLVEKRTL